MCVYYVYVLKLVVRACVDRYRGNALSIYYILCS